MLCTSRNLGDLGDLTLIPPKHPPDVRRAWDPGVDTDPMYVHVLVSKLQVPGLRMQDLGSINIQEGSPGVKSSSEVHEVRSKCTIGTSGRLPRDFSLNMSCGSAGQCFMRAVHARWRYGAYGQTPRTFDASPWSPAAW